MVVQAAEDDERKLKARTLHGDVSPDDTETLAHQLAAARYVEMIPALRRRFFPEGVDLDQISGDRLHQLATLFETGGLGVRASRTRSLELHKLASALGQARSMGIVGEYYESGAVEKRDARKARNLYRAAARLGDVRARCNIARVYYHGLLGQRINVKGARVLWEKVALTRKYRDAQAALGYLYQRGLGGLKMDHGKARQFYALAAEQGCRRSAFNLGLVYELSAVEHADAARLRLAKDWYEKSKALGLGRAALRLDKLERTAPKSSARDLALEPPADTTARDDDSLVDANAPQLGARPTTRNDESLEHRAASSDADDSAAPNHRLANRPPRRQQKDHSASKHTLPNDTDASGENDSP